MRTCQAVVCAVLLQCEGDERPRLPAARCVLSTPTLLAEAAAAGTVRERLGWTSWCGATAWHCGMLRQRC